MRRFLGVACTLWIAASLAGCLFPQVDPPNANGGTGGPETSAGPAPPPTGGAPGPSGGALRTQTWEASGRIGSAGDTGDHAFDIPPHLQRVRILLEWDHPAYDLDLAAELRRIEQGQEGETVWQAQPDTGGAPGAPDSPAVVEEDEASLLDRTDPTRLRVFASSAAAVNVDYTVSVEIAYLE